MSVQVLDFLARFKSLVAERFGLAFDDARHDQLTRVILERMQETSCPDPERYLDRFADPAFGDGEMRALAEVLTVAETYFFRHPDQFQALVEVALPERLRARGSGQGLRILSAGCSSGEEPYTIAMLLKEHFESRASEVEILGLNINAALVRKARAGRYSDWALRGAPESMRLRYFRREGRDFLLDEGIRRMVAFEERNLKAGDPIFWRPGTFDIIFCRNVIMYFTPEAMREVVDRLRRCLAPGGYLFLGPAETLRGLSHAFHLRHSHETFYYQAKEPGEEDEAPSPGWDLRPGSLPDPPSIPDISWLEAIATSTARIEVLSREKAPAPPRAEPGFSASRDLSRAMELLRQERYQEAVLLLRALPPEAQMDPDAQLLLAVLLAQKGEFGDAEALCERILDLDDMSAGAHYLAALCREADGDARGAKEHDEAAAYLDPSFAMPHLHMGLMARRTGRGDLARRELGLAQALLAREEASRILLFGGGFGREALIRLCGGPGSGS